LERGGREEESCFDEVERERELVVRVLLLPKGCFKSSFASFFSLDRQRTSSIEGLSGPRARNAKNRGVLEEKEEEDKKTIDGINNRFRLLLSLSVLRTCADSACSTSAAVVDRWRPSSIAGGDGLSRWRHLGGERRRREKEKRMERRAFFLGVVASELRHTSLFFPCFLALLYFTCCRVLFLLAPSSFKGRGTLALLPPAIGKLRRKRTQLVQWARKRRAQCFSLSLFSRRGGWNSVVRRLGSSHPPRAPLSSSYPASLAPRSADNFEFQPIGGKKDVSRLQAAGSGVERASKMERAPACEASKESTGGGGISLFPSHSLFFSLLSLVATSTFPLR